MALLAGGCAHTIAAKFPDVYPPPAIKPDATRVAWAPVADSRRDESAGWPQSNVTIVAGPEFDQYVDRTFRSRLVEEGFAPIDAANPGGGTNPVQYKTILVTVQSTDVGGTGTFMPHAIASTDIAVQVFAVGGHTIIFAQSYKGTHQENGKTGELLAAAADWAIDAAFSDTAFLQALR